MNGFEIRKELSKRSDEKLLQLYSEMKNDDKENMEIYFRLIDELEYRKPI